MSTRTEYKHLLLHCSVLQHCIGGLYEKDPSPEHDTLIQAIAKELQQVSAACHTLPFNKAILGPISSPSLLSRFPLVSPSVSSIVSRSPLLPLCFLYVISQSWPSPKQAST